MRRGLAFYGIALCAFLAQSCGASSSKDKKEKNSDDATVGSGKNQGSGSTTGFGSTTGSGSTPSGTGSPSGSSSGTPNVTHPDNPPPDGPVVEITSIAPLALDRPDRGQALNPNELKAFTQRYIDLLKATRYFRYIDEHAHGVPEADPKKRYWFGHWWEYTWVERAGKNIKFFHDAKASDNVGNPSAAIMEGTCYAKALYGGPFYDQIVRRMTRSYTAWIKASERRAGDNEGPILMRHFYPEPITFSDRGFTFTYDYSQVRPGTASNMAHNPGNPTWGDIYIKNDRSKDDIGGMMRGLGHLVDCEDGATAAARQDIEEARGHYRLWAKKVIADGYRIATVKKDLQIGFPSGTMGTYFTALNAECPGALMFQMISDGNPKAFDCKDGINPAEAIFAKNHMNRRLVESHHEALVVWARQKRQDAVALPLVQGLGRRLEKTMDSLERGKGDTGYESQTFVTEMLHAANAGVPLTSREIRWLHGQIDAAFKAYVPMGPALYDILGDATPDGKYFFSPWNNSMEFRDFGLPLGTCVSKFRAANARPLLDCSMIRAAKFD